VLPGRFDSCTYNLGYVKQSVYACLTCTHDTKTPAGFCYGCSISCKHFLGWRTKTLFKGASLMSNSDTGHGSHDVLELFVKRKFRCDCGGSKFESKNGEVQQ
jgi:E3 ubiquitin-protein ligase UBR7